MILNYRSFQKLELIENINFLIGGKKKKKKIEIQTWFEALIN
jgi:hypothetical protein